MKLKAIWVLGCLAACALVLVGCGGGNAYAGTTWELTRAEAYGVTLEGDLLESSVGNVSIKFVDDTKLKMEGAINTGESPYKVEGDKIVVTEGDQTLDFVVSGDEISTEYSGVKMYFTKK